MTALFDLPRHPQVPVAGSEKTFPVRRIFCVGRNYAAHAAEMGHEVDREAPFYFTKTPSATVLTGATIPYPPGTNDYHHEMELVVAIGRPAFRISKEDAMSVVYGYACGLDMTRRDRQQDGKDKRRPWDLGKDFEQSAVISPITEAKDFTVGTQKIEMSVNGTVKQVATLDELIWSIPEIINHLSGYYHLEPGDLIYTGTPSGVGAVVAGDHIHGTIDGLTAIDLTLGAAE
ncbi:MAG TPA: fumarylacetoacetase [Rhodobacteraceae bacterium]|jgi:fumarylpyruvate hydrolase|nr:fumarylacetoacetase [Paracoccaceae bacterium]